MKTKIVKKQPYELAVEKFMKWWPYKKETVGAVVCGGYVTGNPSKHSDIDLHILLAKNVKWRERGNKIIDGFLIEYFANPSLQHLKYFQDDFKKNRKVSIHMFITGKIIFDKKGDVKLLIKKAKEWDKRKFIRPGKIKVELNKYSLWDMKDNLEEIYESNGHEFYFVYYNLLKKVFDIYSEFLGFNSISADKMKRFLENKKDQKKYRIGKFPDKIFVRLYLKAMKLSNKKDMIFDYSNVTKHVLKKMGGFNIDGWKIKSKAE